MWEGIVFLQFGDYKHAYNNLESGGVQQYYAQEHSVNYVSKLVDKFKHVTVLCVSTDYPHELLSNDVSVVGINMVQRGENSLLDYLSTLTFSHLVIRTPLVKIINFATRNDIKVLPIIADSFNSDGIKNKIKNHFLVKTLNNDKIKYLGNHSINASTSLSDIGVSPDKIIPWDWPHTIVPEMFEIKNKISSIPTLFYAGQISKEKGIYDLIDAIELMVKVAAVTLEVAGNDKENQLQSYISYKKLDSHISLLGMLPQPDVVNKMASADIVIVPSRHEYPEGLPMTIYEGLASRTPLIVSDHNMFINKVVDSVSGLIFDAGQPDSLAQKCLRLINDADLYQKISTNSAEAWHALRIKVEWTELVSHFIRDDLDNNDMEKISLRSYEGHNV